MSSRVSVARRIANVASDEPVPLSSVSLQYWFNGPDGVAQFETAAPNALFQLKCSDTTTGASGGPRPAAALTALTVPAARCDPFFAPSLSLLCPER